MNRGVSAVNPDFAQEAGIGELLDYAARSPRIRGGRTTAHAGSLRGAGSRACHEMASNIFTATSIRSVGHWGPQADDDRIEVEEPRNLKRGEAK